KRPAHAHIVGATLGGPAMKDRLFFFAAWEGQYQKTLSQQIFNVPPDALRAGDFSRALNSDGSLQIIYDPTTGNPDGTGRKPFPNNKIPDGMISPIAKQLQDLFPAVNLAGTGANGGGAPGARNFIQDANRKFDRNNYGFKVNYNPSSQAQIWGKYGHMDATV